eukprot:scaffold18433_cov36-Cyclotella_meneghiniana.AAC.1
MGTVALQMMRLQDLQLRARNLGIDTHRISEEKTEYGWEGKAKGILQVLWERGWIDPSISYKKYRLTAKDVNGAIVPEL